MKKLLISATVLVMGFAAFAQNLSYTKKWYKDDNAPAMMRYDLFYEVRGNYEHPVTKSTLSKAKLVSDFIEGYPVNWVSDYVSVEIIANCNSKEMKATSANDVLSAEQKSILNTIDTGTGLVVNVKYKSHNAVTDEIVINTMNAVLMVIPETEAEYVGGYALLKKYLKENVIDKIADATQLQNASARVVFVVNEQGEITDAKLTGKLTDANIKNLLLEAITNMPKWKPAHNAKGASVKQEFVFTVGNSGC